MKKIFILILIIIGLLLLGWIFRAQLLELYFKKQKEEAKEAYFLQSPEAKIVNVQKKIEEDIKILSTYPLFKSLGTGTHDAASYLNPLVSWNLGLEKKKGTLTLPEELSELLRSKSDFNELTLDWTKWNLDFSFFQNSHQYDYWAYDNESPFTKNETNFKIDDIPQIEYSELIAWSKLRLIYGRDHNDLDQAIKDVTHLAKLVMSNENSSSSMASIALMNLAAKVMKTPEILTETIPVEHLTLAKRFFWANENFTDLRLSPKTFELFSESSVGLCSRINDALMANISYREFLGAELKQNFDRLNTLVKKTENKCRPSYIRRAWADSQFQGYFEDDNDPYGKLTKSLGISNKDLKNYPELSATMGFLYISISSLDKLKDY